MTLKIVFFTGLLVAVLALPSELSGSSVSQAPANYEFQYAVMDDSSGNNFGQQEHRDGDFTQGSYHLRLPDGRLLKVSYTVSRDSGYVAQVTYEGEARYPAS